MPRECVKKVTGFTYCITKPAQIHQGIDRWQYDILPPKYQRSDVCRDCHRIIQGESIIW